MGAFCAVVYTGLNLFRYLWTCQRRFDTKFRALHAGRAGAFQGFCKHFRLQGLSGQRDAARAGRQRSNETVESEERAVGVGGAEDSIAVSTA